jgi:hypothetical protein
MQERAKWFIHLVETEQAWQRRWEEMQWDKCNVVDDKCKIVVHDTKIVLTLHSISFSRVSQIIFFNFKKKLFKVPIYPCWAVIRCLIPFHSYGFGFFEFYIRSSSLIFWDPQSYVYKESPWEPVVIDSVPFLIPSCPTLLSTTISYFHAYLK